MDASLTFESTWEVPMLLPTNGVKGTNGIRRLVALYRKQFRIPENLDHYSAEDLLVAERKFIKYALQDGHQSTSAQSDGGHI